MKFLWTTIHVSDLDKSIAFYSGLLDLPVIERFHGTGNEIAMLGEADGTHLELLCRPGRPETVGQGVSVGFPRNGAAGPAVAISEPMGYNTDNRQDHFIVGRAWRPQVRRAGSPRLRPLHDFSGRHGRTPPAIRT